MASIGLLRPRTLCLSCLARTLLKPPLEVPHNASLHISAPAFKGGPRTQPKFFKAMRRAGLEKKGYDEETARRLVKRGRPRTGVKNMNVERTELRQFLPDVEQRLPKMTKSSLRDKPKEWKLYRSDVLRNRRNDQKNTLKRVLTPFGLSAKLGYLDSQNEQARDSEILDPERSSDRSQRTIRPFMLAGTIQDRIDTVRRAQGRAEIQRHDRSASNSVSVVTMHDAHQATKHISASPHAITIEKYSPPLLSGILSCLQERIGMNAGPTSIQQLSLDFFFGQYRDHYRKPGRSQVLLAAETGSGKTYAYLLPMIQGLKETESPEAMTESLPRGLILAPTHELCRQLAHSVKGLTHISKLRTECLSNPPVKRSTPIWDETTQREDTTLHPADVLVGTPSAMLNAFRLTEGVEEQVDVHGEVVIKGDFGTSRGLEKVEWVIVDEADVLLGKDFRPATRALLHFIREARLSQSPNDAGRPLKPLKSLEDRLPFNLVFSTATISSGFEAYLTSYHPHIARLRSANLHTLPGSLKFERVNCPDIKTKDSEIAQYIKKIWSAENKYARLLSHEVPEITKSRVLVFCNDSGRATKFGEYIKQVHGIPNLVLTAETAERVRHKGSNHHLDGFLLGSKGEHGAPSRSNAEPDTKVPEAEVLDTQMVNPVKEAGPLVLVTTSLLSRGLDFSPTVKNVLIADEPKDMVDFMHRAGRSGRAGMKGKVVVFSTEKASGRENWMQELRSRMKLGQQMTA